MSSELDWFKSSHSGPDGGNCVEVAAAWRKSTYSGTDGGNCVEVAAAWRKSTYSGSDGGNCVEVAVAPRTVRVRDSKVVGGPELGIEALAWASFVHFAVNGRHMGVR